MKQLIENTLTAVKKLLPAGTCFLAAVTLAGIGPLAVHPAPAQARDSPKPSFDVASIKPSDCRSPGKYMRFQPGRYSACAPLERFIISAYSMGDEEMEEEDILGGPGWRNSDCFSIEAKAEGVTDRSTLRLMLQSLLEERFRLKAHYETREQPVYSLVVAKGGHKLKEARDENGGIIEFMPQRGLGIIGTNIPKQSRPKPPPFPIRFPGGITMRLNAKTGQQEIVAYAVTMQNFADKALQRLTGRNVVDKTGLKGYYDIELHIAFQPHPDLRSRSEVMQPASSSPTDPMLSAELSGPSIFTAIQEQLGLKLEADKAPVEFLVIDSAEKPSEN